MTDNEMPNRAQSAIPVWVRRRWGMIAAAAALLTAGLGFVSDIQGLIFGSTLSAREAQILAEQIAVRMDNGAGTELSVALQSFARDGGRRDREGLRQLGMGESGPALDTLEAATGRIAQRDVEAAADRMVNLGVIAEGIDTARAIGYYERALVLSPHRPRTVNRLGTALFNTGVPARAAQLHTRALELAWEQGDVREEVIALAGLGAIDANAGDFAQAGVRYAEALELADSLGDLRLSARMLGNRGFAAQGSGDGASARSYYERALSLMDSSGDHVGAALARNNLANYEREAGELDAAEDNYRLALAALEIAGRQPLGALVLQNLGETAQARGDLEAADRFYRRALDRARTYDYAAYIASSARRAGWLALGRDEAGEAIVLGEESLDAMLQLGDPAGEADARILLVGANGLAGDHETARRHAARVFEIFESVAPPDESLGYLQSALGLMAFRDGDRDAARVHSQLGRDAFARAGQLAQAAEQDRRLATLAIDAGDHGAACRYLTEALDGYARLQDIDEVARVRARLTETNCPQRG